VEEFGATTPELERKAAWLQERNVESVAMESTGVYWIAPHEVLERYGFEIVLVDARKLARVPGRKKSERMDCEWIQRLHSCGLLTGSFRPNEQVCMLRTLVRDKAILVAETGDWLRRMQKRLDQMNVRVHRAVSDIDGVTGMAMVRAIVAGERDARQLAKLRDRRCHQSEEAMAEQLSGHWRADHLFTLGQTLKMYDAIQERIAEYEREIMGKLAEMEREECRGQAAPKLNNPKKAQAIKKRGEEPSAPGAIPDQRGESGRDRCNRCGNGAIGPQRIRHRLEHVSHREGVRLAHHISPPQGHERRQAGEETEEARQRQ
jgi:transposase